MKTSVIEEVGGSKDFLSYEDKYLGNSKTKGKSSKGMASTNRILPARLDDKLTKSLLTMMLLLYE